MSELGIVFHPENCIQCHACEVACKSWRGLAHGAKWRPVHTPWHGAYPAITMSSLSGLSPLHT